MNPEQAEEYVRYLEKENKAWLDALEAKHSRKRYEPEQENIGAGVTRTTFRPVPPNFFEQP